MRLGLFVSVSLTSALLVACGGQMFTATLSGANEVPAVTTTGTGSVSGTLEGSVLTLNGSFSGLSGNATAAHVHGPADAGSNAGVAFALSMDAGTAAGSGGLSATQTLTADQLTALNEGRLYVNVHTAANPGGEIRGQLMKQ